MHAKPLLTTNRKEPVALGYRFKSYAVQRKPNAPKGLRPNNGKTVAKNRSKTVDLSLCRASRCRNPHRKGHRFCHKHLRRLDRSRNRMWAAWRSLKDHAKARGIRFALSLEYFRTFALKTDYLNKTGPWGHCLTVDRINNLRGYVPGNIQPLTRSKNAEKQARRDAIRMRCGYAWQEKKAA